jgi:hypothetical protein
MEHLFNYTVKLSSELNSLIEDLFIFQRISSEKKSSSLTGKNIENTKIEIKRKIFFLKVLEQVSYLSDVNVDISRAIAEIDLLLTSNDYSPSVSRKIYYYLSSIYQNYEKAEETKSPTLQHKLIQMLEDTMKVTEEILLSFYGLSSPEEDLEEKLIKTVEALFAIKLEDLEMDEKFHVEAFFNNIQDAFREKSLEGWETAYIKCTGIMNDLKEKMGFTPPSILEITYETKDQEFQIFFDPLEEDDEDDEDDDEYDDDFLG